MHRTCSPKVVVDSQTARFSLPPHLRLAQRQSNIADDRVPKMNIKTSEKKAFFVTIAMRKHIEIAHTLAKTRRYCREANCDAPFINTHQTAAAEVILPCGEKIINLPKRRSAAASAFVERRLNEAPSQVHKEVLAAAA